jgi:catechol 2,3-dioxygenase
VFLPNSATWLVATATRRVALLEVSSRSRTAAEEASMSVTVSQVGHVVLRVANVQRSLAFYNGVLGLSEVVRRHYGEELWVFLSTGNTHHDVALVEAVGAVNTASGSLHHVAFKVGDSLNELADVKLKLKGAGVPVHAALDFQVSQALFVSDPDGTLVELYVDAPDKPWRDDPALVANAEPLDLII